MFDPGLFPPESRPNYEIVEFWGPYVSWELTPDVIVFGSNHTLDVGSSSPDSADYAAWKFERQAYGLYVVEKGARCSLDHCFHREVALPNGGEILVLGT